MYHCFASKLVSNKAVIATENPTQPHPCSVHQLKYLQSSYGSKVKPEDTLKTFSATVRLLCGQLLVSQLGWQWLLRCLSWSVCISLVLQEHSSGNTSSRRDGFDVQCLISKNHLYYMDDRQHNPQLGSA